ncbi:hypothetical protein OKW22_000775 [Bacilli bacterium PM5-3]|nr:hypothetical protein [Bacilli bacterium PM5-3]MDH6603823.1 hypothetical protein [Bacilli bacterium PM5-9]
MGFFQILSYLIIYICLPVTIIATLVYLILLFKQLTVTVKKVDALSTNIEQKMELLEGPIETIVNINNSYLQVISAFSAVATTIGAFAKGKRKK